MLQHNILHISGSPLSTLPDAWWIHFFFPPQTCNNLTTTFTFKWWPCLLIYLESGSCQKRASTSSHHSVHMLAFLLVTDLISFTLDECPRSPLELCVFTQGHCNANLTLFCITKFPLCTGLFPQRKTSLKCLKIGKWLNNCGTSIPWHTTQK